MIAPLRKISFSQLEATRDEAWPYQVRLRIEFGFNTMADEWHTIRLSRDFVAELDWTELRAKAIRAGLAYLVKRADEASNHPAYPETLLTARQDVGMAA